MTNYEFASEGFTICMHTTSLTFDLTSDQEKLPRKKKKNFHRGKKGRNLQESNRGGSLSLDGQKQWMSCVQKESLQNYINTMHEYDNESFVV